MRSPLELFLEIRLLWKLCSLVVEYEVPGGSTLACLSLSVWVPPSTAKDAGEERYPHRCRVGHQLLQPFPLNLKVSSF